MKTIRVKGSSGVMVALRADTWKVRDDRILQIYRIDGDERECVASFHDWSFIISDGALETNQE